LPKKEADSRSATVERSSAKSLSSLTLLITGFISERFLPKKSGISFTKQLHHSFF